jgi:hypothetical protein
MKTHGMRRTACGARHAAYILGFCARQVAFSELIGHAGLLQIHERAAGEAERRMNVTPDDACG